MVLPSNCCTRSGRLRLLHMLCRVQVRPDGPVAPCLPQSLPLMLSTGICLHLPPFAAFLHPRDWPSRLCNFLAGVRDDAQPYVRARVQAARLPAQSAGGDQRIHGELGSTRCTVPVQASEVHCHEAAPQPPRAPTHTEQPA